MSSGCRRALRTHVEPPPTTALTNLPVIAAYSALSVVIFFLFFELIRLAGAVAVGQVAYIITLTGLGWGALLYGERPSPWIWLAIALVFAGVGLVNFGKSARKPDKVSRRPV